MIIIQLLLYIGSTEEVVSLFEVEFQKPRNLSESESEECGSGEGVCVFASLMKSDTVQSYGRVKADTRPVGVELRKKPKDLSASEREERGHGKGVGCMLLFFFCQFSPFFFLCRHSLQGDGELTFSGNPVVIERVRIVSERARIVCSTQPDGQVFARRCCAGGPSFFLRLQIM